MKNANQYTNDVQHSQSLGNTDFTPTNIYVLTYMHPVIWLQPSIIKKVDQLCAVVCGPKSPAAVGCVCPNKPPAVVVCVCPNRPLAAVDVCAPNSPPPTAAVAGGLAPNRPPVLVAGAVVPNRVPAEK